MPRLTIRNRLTLAAGEQGTYLARLAAAGPIRTITGAPGRYAFSAAALQQAAADGLLDGVACFIDHIDNPGLHNLFGRWSNVAYSPHDQALDAVLTPFRTALQQPYIDMLDQIVEGPPLDVGVSLVFYPELAADGRTISRIESAESADLVMFPAVESARILARLEAEEEEPMPPEELVAPVPAPAPDPTPWVQALQQTTAGVMIAQAGLPAPVADRLRQQAYPTPDDVTAAIDAARAELAALQEHAVIQLGTRPAVAVRDPLDDAAEHMAWFFGLRTAAPPPANMRRFIDFYVALTGDINAHGVFSREHVRFAAATAATLANLTVNAMNRRIVECISNLDDWRWYEMITRVQPNDGSLHDMQWITFGGIGNLPTVAEGAAYTELAVDDVKESSTFIKRGGYVGITREMILKSDVQMLQAVPDALAVAALRTRSEQVSNIFTANNGVGPTLAQDNVALFHASHSNLATTALGTDAAAWRAARTECYKHTEVGSGKRLGIRPRYLLIPVDLYDTALAILGYGEGMPTTYVPEAQSRGFMDPRPTPIAVPDWTDTTDWAYIVDPRVFPVIHMSYSQQPAGGGHPAPELFSVTSETSGLMFSNDTLPIKVRDEFAVGVSGYRGIGKRNVA